MCAPEKMGPEKWKKPLPVENPGEPCRGWSIDLLGPYGLDEDGNRYLAVATDVFTKWPEASPIPNKRAFTTCAWFYNDIVARWGRPSFARMDHGAEWMAEFREAMTRLHIAVRQGATGNSRANG